jgi:hypothetical protein
MITASNLYKYAPADFARCAGSGRDECKTCTRNIEVSPVHPSASRQVWIGRWELDERCPSRVPLQGAA